MSHPNEARTGRTLDAFMRDHAVWDPMPLWDGRRFLLYLLTMSRDQGFELGSFFTRENVIHVFESTDLRSWEHLGLAIRPRTEKERLCAGNPLYHDGRYWFFGSATVDQYDDNHLDQRLFLAVSDDGVNFDEVPGFVLEPDPLLCPHRRFHPDDGRMLFAWRDPWPVYDEKSGQFLVFVCTGGERWGCAPDVVVAASNQLTGPYTVIGSVLDTPSDGTGDRHPAFREIERVNVLAQDGRWFLTFSCWRRLVDPVVLVQNDRLSDPLSDFSVYVAEADAASGPFSFSRERPPVISGSHASGFYGTTFFGKDDGVRFGLGWDWPEFRIEPTRIGRLTLTAQRSSHGATLKIHTPRFRTLLLRARRFLKNFGESVS